MIRTMRPVFGALAALLMLAGCSKSTLPTESQMFSGTPPQLTQSRPVPDSPANVLLTLAWSVNHRDWQTLSELFTDDYEFVFAATDSAGNAFPNRAILRDGEIGCSRHLFETGTATEPPCSSINLVLDRAFVFFPDSRPGKEYPWHQEARTQVTLTIDAGEQQYRILGHARFFVVRGDSAAIPAALVARGFRPDAHRWWIQRWEDETVPGGGGIPSVAGTLPSGAITWGDIKALYY